MSDLAAAMRAQAEQDMRAYRRKYGPEIQQSRRVSRSAVMKLHERGYSSAKIGEAVGCSAQYVQRVIREAR